MNAGTTQRTITLSLADARKLAAGELREVLIAVKPAIGHRKQILPLNRGWMLCDETAECPSDGMLIRAPYQPGDVLAVKEPFALHGILDNGKTDRHHRAYLEFADTGVPWLSVPIDAAGLRWCEGNLNRPLKHAWQAARTMPLWAVRHWLRVTACEPVQEGEKWWWRVGVEKAEKPE